MNLGSLARSALVLCIASTTGCNRNEAASAAGHDARPSESPHADAGPTNATPAPSAAAFQRGECPLAIEPGVALGPVRIGQSREDLERLGLVVEPLSSDDKSAIVRVGPFGAKLCGGKVVDTWLDDLRKAPDCVSHAGQKLDRSMSRERFIALFHDCKPAPPRTGGEFSECEDSGIRIGYGMGDFIQVRVGQKGTRLDDSCEMLLDDGSPVPLPAETQAKLLQRTLDLDLLAPFWHPDQPGRDPLKVVDNDIVRSHPKLSMFGSDVVFVARTEAEKKKLPFFEFEKLEASATKVTLSFRFPVESVVGSVTFRKRFDDWLLEEKHVAER